MSAAVQVSEWVDGMGVYSIVYHIHYVSRWNSILCTPHPSGRFMYNNTNINTESASCFVSCLSVRWVSLVGCVEALILRVVLRHSFLVEDWGMRSEEWGPGLNWSAAIPTTTLTAADGRDGTATSATLLCSNSIVPLLVLSYWQFETVRDSNSSN